MTQAIDLFSPFHLGPLPLPNRIVMAPMTRNRAGGGNAPTALNATHYAQRASAGLIVAEASQVSPQGIGYPGTPGIHSAEQIAGWKLVTNAAHAAGGRIFLQLWHVGRISHPSLQPDGALPVAPSAIAPAGQAWTLDGMKPYVTPRALETAEIPGIVEQYRQGAANAKAAGFDGIEVHAAHGYLLDQFLRDKTNKRTDRYGGNAANRARIVVEVMEAVAGVWGAERTGVHLSPTNLTFNDISDSDPAGTFTTAVRELDRLGLGYLHLVEPGPADPVCLPPPQAGDGGRSTLNSSARCGAARSSPTRPTISRAPMPCCKAATPIWCRSRRCSSPIRTCHTGCVAAVPSLRPSARLSMAAARVAIRIIRRYDVTSCRLLAAAHRAIEE